MTRKDNDRSKTNIILEDTPERVEAHSPISERDRESVSYIGHELARARERDRFVAREVELGRVRDITRDRDSYVASEYDLHKTF